MLSVELAGSSAGSILFAFIAATFAALFVMLAATPREEYREREAVLKGSRVGRAVQMLPLFLIAIVLPLSNRGHQDDQLVIGTVHVTRYHLVQACMLVAFASSLVLAPLYCSWRSSRVKKPA